MLGYMLLVISYGLWILWIGVRVKTRNSITNNEIGNTLRGSPYGLPGDMGCYEHTHP